MTRALAMLTVVLFMGIGSASYAEKKAVFAGGCFGALRAILST